MFCSNVCFIWLFLHNRASGKVQGRSETFVWLNFIWIVWLRIFSCLFSLGIAMDTTDRWEFHIHLFHTSCMHEIFHFADCTGMQSFSSCNVVATFACVLLSLNLFFSLNFCSQLDFHIMGLPFFLFHLQHYFLSTVFNSFGLCFVHSVVRCRIPTWAVLLLFCLTCRVSLFRSFYTKIFFTEFIWSFQRTREGESMNLYVNCEHIARKSYNGYMELWH